MKIVHIDRIKFSFLLNNLRNFSETFKKDVTYDNIENHKKSGLYILSVEDAVLEKSQ